MKYERPAHELRPEDFIPLYGFKKYDERNRFERSKMGNREILFGYNLILTSIVAIASGILFVKSLESLIN